MCHHTCFFAGNPQRDAISRCTVLVRCRHCKKNGRSLQTKLRSAPSSFHHSKNHRTNLGIYKFDVVIKYSTRGGEIALKRVPTRFVDNSVLVKLLFYTYPYAKKIIIFFNYHLFCISN